jgi:hypothetical protein
MDDRKCFLGRTLMEIFDAFHRMAKQCRNYQETFKVVWGFVVENCFP